MNNANYLKYKKLKEDINISYKGYELKYILATDIIYFFYENMKDISKKTIKECLYKVKDPTTFHKKISENGVLFSFADYGSDHRNLMNSIMLEVNSAILLEEDRKLKPYFSWLNTFVSFFQVFFGKAFRNLSRNDKFYFFLKLTSYKNFIDVIESCNKVAITAYVPYLSAITNDSIYCQFFRKRNIKSYCIQHGVHLPTQDYKNYVPLDVVNLENLQADFMLGWGNYTLEGLIKEGYNQSRYLLAGNPKYSNIRKIVVDNTDFHCCMVCLARDSFKEENIMLLHIIGQLESSGVQIFVKLHPRCNIDNYISVIKQYNFTLIEKSISIKDSLSLYNPDFAIVYNSTVYYEYYLNNILAFRYSVNQSDIPFGLSDDFRDFETLRQRIEEFKSMNTSVLNEEINEVIGRFCALGVNNYAAILNG